MLIFVPCEMQRTNWEMWHGSLFYSSYGPNRWYNIGGAVLGVYRFNGGYIRHFPLLPSGVPIAPTDLTVGGPNLPEVWYGDTPLTNLFFISDKAPQFKNTAVRRRLGSKFWPKFVTFCPLYKGEQRGSNVCGYFEFTTVVIISAGA